MSASFLCALLLALAPQQTSQQTNQPANPQPQSNQSSFERGVDAYRRGDHATAIAQWHATLAEDVDDLSRARVYHDLGNAHWRAGDSARAIACYTAAVRLDPRNTDAWQNLELARAKAGLPPADAGDLSATTRRVLASLRPDERRALLFGALVLWTVALAFEVRLGGARARAALVGASLVLALALVPWASGRLARDRHAPMLVITSAPVSLRSEPMDERAALGELASLEEVERVDELPGWVRVERADGQRGWVRAENLFALELGGGG